MFWEGRFSQFTILTSIVSMTPAGEDENLSFFDEPADLKWERMSAWYRWKTSGMMSH